MRILQVSESDNIGGAAIASSKLNDLLNSDISFESKLLVNRKKTNAIGTVFPTSILHRLHAKLMPHILIKYNKVKFGTSELTISKNRSSLFFLKSIKNIKFDILHLHWVNNGFVGLDDLHLINKPLVWTLHDNWLFTGACHSTQGCNKFFDNCYDCPKVNKKKFQDNLERQFLEKLDKLQKLKDKINIIVPSQWMYENAKKSKILSGFRIDIIPNFINTNLFIPKDKDDSKEKLGFDKATKYLLFGATDPINDSNKGFLYIQQMAARGALDGYTLIIFGKVNDPNEIKLDIPFIIMDSIYDKNKLVLLYNTAEVVIMPSLHESFGQVAAEAMSCGIPVLCYDTSGLKDVVDHKINGYRAELKNVNDLIEGFNWIIGSVDLCTSARLKVVKSFSEQIILKKYLVLYSNLIKLENKNDAQ